LNKKNISIILGTRPEGIKLLPLVKELKKIDEFAVRVISTGQHREMLQRVFKLFDERPDIDLDLMSHNQSLEDIGARVLTDLPRTLKSAVLPDMLIVQGDTSTAFYASLVSFYAGVPVAHVEAGLRTDTVRTPFPEELNRRLISRIAELHFCPTAGSKDNLLSEGIASSTVFITGNTGIDALFAIRDRMKGKSLSNEAEKWSETDGTRLLLTLHRRENFGRPIADVCRALRELLSKYPNLSILVPVHPNPEVRRTIIETLSQLERVFLSDPLDFPEFVVAMDRSSLILSDSGGVQEEAPALGKPVLVLREFTERPDAILSGNVKLVGTDCGCIVETVSSLLDNPEKLKSMSKSVSPYGDGAASNRIVRILKNRLLGNSDQIDEFSFPLLRK
jgi:UDP-N-acetylglucosamine 2-epimerase (non-hydrolysing)